MNELHDYNGEVVMPQVAEEEIRRLIADQHPGDPPVGADDESAEVEYFTCQQDRLEREDVIRLLRFQLKHHHLNDLGRRRANEFLSRMKVD